MAEFTADVQQSLLGAIAATAGVQVSSVRIVSVVQGAGRRRRLLAQGPGIAIEIAIEVPSTGGNHNTPPLTARITTDKLNQELQDRNLPQATMLKPPVMVYLPVYDTNPTSTPSPSAYQCGNDVCPHNGGGLWAKVYGQSGKIELAPTSNVASNPNSVRFEISALRELDSSGNTLGRGGSSKHSFNSFSTQAFTFGAVQHTAYKGVECIKIPFSSMLDTGSKIEIDLFLFKQSGTLQVGNETFSVTNR
jgi:hypothetical protein